MNCIIERKLSGLLPSITIRWVLLLLLLLIIIFFCNGLYLPIATSWLPYIFKFQFLQCICYTYLCIAYDVPNTVIRKLLIININNCPPYVNYCLSIVIIMLGGKKFHTVQLKKLLQSLFNTSSLLLTSIQYVLYCPTKIIHK